MGGKSKPTATNDQMVQMQMQQAAQAKTANMERNARLQGGTQEINQIFQGVPAGSQLLDFSGAPAASPNFTTDSPTTGWGLNVPNMPAGYSMTLLPDDGSGVPQYGLADSSGNLVNSGSLQDIANTKIYAGGSGPAVDPWQSQYDKYRQAQLDYYLPQEGQQYDTARSNLSYSLARAGTLNSSIAAQDVSTLANQDKINQAQIASQADQATAGIRNTVQQDQEAALNQLYSTEDPSVAANTAENMVSSAASQLQKPVLNPLGALFTPIMAGVGNAISGFTNPYAYISNSSNMVGSTPGGSSSAGVVHPSGS